MIKAFNKRFPEIKVEMVRAPGGQLITRIKTEAAAGKLAADVIDHSDRALMKDLVGLFQDYTPPNGGDYLPDALVSPKLWPRVTLVWSIAYNAALVKKPPKSWMDLTKPEYGKGADRPGDRAVGRHDLDARCSSARSWARTTGRGRRRPTRRSIPPARRCRRALVRGEVRSRPLLYNIVYTKKRTAHRWRFSSRPRACRSTPMPAACRRRQRTRTPPSCSSTGACPRKARPS